MKNFIYFLVLMLATSLFFRCLDREEKKDPKPVNDGWVEIPAHTELQKYFISQQKDLCWINNSINEAVFCLNFKKGDTVFASKEKEIFNGHGSWWASQHETVFYRIGSDGVIDAVVNCKVLQ